MSLQDQVSPVFLPTQGFPRWSRKKRFWFGHIAKILYWPSLFSEDGWILESFFVAFLLALIKFFFVHKKTKK